MVSDVEDHITNMTQNSMGISACQLEISHRPPPRSCSFGQGLTGLLSDVLDSEAAIEATLQEILARYTLFVVFCLYSAVCRWQQSQQDGSKVEDVAGGVEQIDITEKMHQITQQKIAASPVIKLEKTEEEKRLKAAILNGFSAGGSGSEDESDGGGDLGPANSNAESVQKEAAENREKQAAAAAAKKDKDKQDRANQKNKEEERKKKAQEKAAKGERKSGR